MPTPTAEGRRVASVAAAHHRYAAVAFLGSGTTVIAAERSGRRCCALELDPGYVEGHASGLGTIRPASRSPAGPPVLGRNAEGALTAIRTPEPGELYRYHLGRLAWTDQLVADHGVRRAPCAADLEAAHNTGQPAIIADVEGLDFLEMKLERLEEAHQRGIRHVQLVHYTPNDIGDFQTGAITHRGLSEFGAEVIRACQRMGGCGLTARRRASTGYNSSRPIRCTKIRAARAEGRPFQNPLEPRTLEWRS